ncbi:hypothetical protein MHUMG1_00002 [Metarhizium humberi]|uniref:CCHC-type domain-containing protein n=1 Tax=Metarhizium humberi TaxID=2596975 RepID=A0A9P8MIY8_9HYPO|nr:hypothetical protein MHUMG1_00002 [Metarhizium humberi]
MATPWPEDQTWPTDHREHAAKLSTCLQKALSSIESPNRLPIKPRNVRHAIIGALNLIVKVQSLPDLTHIHEAIRNTQHETKTAAQNTSKAIGDIRDELKTANRMTSQTITTIQDNANVALATGAAAKEAVEIGKATYKMVKDMKPSAAPSQSNIAQTYVSIVARGGLAASMHNPVNYRTSPVQAQREIMSPRSLKAHIDRAIEQSNSEHIQRIKVVSSNQLKTGDLSIKTVTSSMDMDHFDELRVGILQDDTPFIPNAEIKYIGWLTKSSSSKSASSVIVEFARAEDANRIIDEGLIWQGEVFQCERYDRQCRLRQCFRCHKYGHIGTQCRATIACGYCAQDHPTRECPAKNDDKAPRKCAACRGEHEAWSGQCPTQKEEMAKIKAAYKARPKYHPEPWATIRPGPRK